MRHAGITKKSSQGAKKVSGFRCRRDVPDSAAAAMTLLSKAEVTNLVTGINAQRETMAQMMEQQSAFLKLATRQADIIGELAKVRAS